MGGPSGMGASSVFSVGVGPGRGAPDRCFDATHEWQTQPSKCAYGKGGGAQYLQLT